ncbi:aminoglycoside phosphotransferase family protein [Aquihabitans sp. McL0605]|uniref:aminoglycoside phosphotransferase family protein n=1 Tax=Aquihabitans sp. McL0605 TaxID=3415671 RepID=UPI003CF3CC9A
MIGAVDPPAPEVEITEELVRSLLAAQHPDLADRPLTPLDAGWDNVTFRLGPDLVVRLPRRAVAAPLIVSEQRWLPELAAHLPLPVPVAVRTGVPSARYPWPWSVTPWFPGTSALAQPPADLERAAAQLGAFVAALHRPAPAEAPANPYRGIPLADRDEQARAAIEALGTTIDGPAALACWARHAALPPWAGPALWLHGDLHPHNVIVHHGEVAAVIDFGDITSGDPATDLAIAWMLLPPAARPALRSAAGVDDGTWERGRGWALALALAYVSSPLSTPDFVRLGRATITSVLTDPT